MPSTRRETIASPTPGGEPTAPADEGPTAEPQASAEPGDEEDAEVIMGPYGPIGVVEPPAEITIATRDPRGEGFPTYYEAPEVEGLPAVTADGNTLARLMSPIALDDGDPGPTTIEFVETSTGGTLRSFDMGSRGLPSAGEARGQRMERRGSQMQQELRDGGYQPMHHLGTVRLEMSPDAPSNIPTGLSVRLRFQRADGDDVMWGSIVVEDASSGEVFVEVETEDAPESSCLDQPPSARAPGEPHYGPHRVDAYFHPESRVLCLISSYDGGSHCGSTERRHIVRLPAR